MQELSTDTQPKCFSASRFRAFPASQHHIQEEKNKQNQQKVTRVHMGAQNMSGRCWAKMEESFFPSFSSSSSLVHLCFG
jgi:hypothetical protein